MTVPAKYRQYKAMVIPVVIVMIILGAAIIAFMNKGEDNDSIAGTRQSQKADPSTLPAHGALSSPSVAVQLPDATKEQLLYLIEEEKLAHDVYLKMYELYGARVFANILKSETNHQSRVLTLLVATNTPDPRSAKVGEFTNKDLQALYDKLVARGGQSLSQAYAVGVAIEELDITDIQKDLKTLDSTQTDVKATLEALLRGSQNHLRAFNRQVG